MKRAQRNICALENNILEQRIVAICDQHKNQTTEHEKSKRMRWLFLCCSRCTLKQNGLQRKRRNGSPHKICRFCAKNYFVWSFWNNSISVSSSWTRSIHCFAAKKREARAVGEGTTIRHNFKEFGINSVLPVYSGKLRYLPLIWLFHYKGAAIAIYIYAF